MALTISLRFSTGAHVLLRDLTGLDEQCVCDTSTKTAIELLDRLVDHPGEAPWRTAKLTASDRDRLLAAVYRLAYGGRVRSVVACNQCGKPFDLDLSLDELMAAVNNSAKETAARTPDGSFRTSSGVRFRLPNGEDELAAIGIPSEDAGQALFERCLLEAPPGIDARAAVEQAIEELAPVADFDLSTACPECDAEQQVSFVLQFYVLRSLEQEREQRVRETHRIACAYGWSSQEILNLKRRERRAFAALIESEWPVRRRPQ